VAVSAGIAVAVPIWARGRSRRAWIAGYALAGALGAATTGPWLVLVLLGCGAIELTWRGLAHGSAGLHAWPALGALADPGGTGALVWTAFKVGALAFGGGFVIVPLMQADAVNTYHWMTHAQFLNAVALGQITPGPIVHTVAAVGYSADGLAGGLLAALVAFAPSFAFILFGAPHFERLLRSERVAAFLAGAAPAAAGAIIGSALPLGLALSETWQVAVLALAAVLLLLLRRAVVPTLLAGGAIGVAAGLLGAPLPR
jgi:chromate transporter